MKLAGSHLSWLESESIHILREAVAEARNPVMLFSAGKDSTVMAHLALRAFYPATPPFPLLHVDSTWEFRSLIAFRDDFAAKHVNRRRRLPPDRRPKLTPVSAGCGRFAMSFADGGRPPGRACQQSSWQSEA